MWPHANRCDLVWPHANRCDQVWHVTRCDQCDHDQVWPMWPGVTFVTNVTRLDQMWPMWPMWPVWPMWPMWPVWPMWPMCQDVPRCDQCDKMWPDETRCDKMWTDETRCEQCDQMWPGVTYVTKKSTWLRFLFLTKRLHVAIGLLGHFPLVFIWNRRYLQQQQQLSCIAFFQEGKVPLCFSILRQEDFEMIFTRPRIRQGISGGE